MSRSRNMVPIWIVAAVGCAGTPAAPASPLRDGRSAAAGDASGEATRGMRIEGAPSATPFVLEATPHARRLQNGISIARGELHDGDTVTNGERLQLSLRTSERAHVVLAFCSQLAAGSTSYGLTMYPAQGSIQVNANETTILPDKASEIVLDDKPGREALYLIVSHDELSLADSRLAAAFTAARQAGQAADCGGPFRAALAGPSQARPAPGPLRSDRSPPMPPATKREPVVVIERGGDVVWNSGVNGDTSGIAVLRYGFTHVAPASSP